MSTPLRYIDDQVSDSGPLVQGMSCEHCARAVTQELLATRGWRASTSISRAAASSSPAPDSTRAVRAAVDEAGYEVAS